MSSSSSCSSSSANTTNKGGRSTLRMSILVDVLSVVFLALSPMLLLRLTEDTTRPIRPFKMDDPHIAHPVVTQHRWPATTMIWTLISLYLSIVAFLSLVTVYRHRPPSSTQSPPQAGAPLLSSKIASESEIRILRPYRAFWLLVGGEWIVAAEASAFQAALVFMLKTSIVSMRPSFLGLCDPDPATMLCRGSNQQVQFALQSFPSGHAGFSFAMMASLFASMARFSKVFYGNSTLRHSSVG